MSATQFQPVDFVILSWNRVHATLHLIDNLLAQSGIQPRLWILDQGSNASQLARLRERCSQIPEIHLEEIGRNVGTAAGRNRGIALGRAEIVVCLDNDAELKDPAAVRKILERFRQRPEVGAIGFRILDWKTEQDDRFSWAYPQNLESHARSEFLTTRYCGAGHALRRAAFEKTRGYDESLFFYWEELDLSYQLIESGYRVLYDPSVIILHKLDPEQRYFWKIDRYYYHVRNALYIDYKFFHEPARTLAFTLGYLLKGLYNLLPAQAFRGVVDAMRMIRRLDRRALPNLNHKAVEYIRTHDWNLRGSLFNRIRREVLVRLPGR